MATGGIQGQLLEITIVGCTRLRDTEWISRQDPYVCLEYANSKFRTKTCTDGGKNPTFNEKFVLPLIEGLRDVNVSVWNSNTLQFDDLIGTGRILLQKVLSSGYDDTSWTLTTRSGKNAGEVRIILHYSNTSKNKAQSATLAPPYTGQLPTSTPYAPPMGYPPIQQPSTAYSGYPPIQQSSTAYSGYPPMTAYKSEPTTAYPPIQQSSTAYSGYPPMTAYKSEPTTAYPPQSNVYPPPQSNVYPPPPSDVYPSPSSYQNSSSAYASPFGTSSPSPFAPAVYPPPSPFAPAVYPPQPYAGHYPGVYPPQ